VSKLQLLPNTPVMLFHRAFLQKAARLLCLSFIALLLVSKAFAQRTTADFDKGWHFNLGDVKDGESSSLNDVGWRTLDLPHDWSIEGKFSKDNPATPEGGALPGAMNWVSGRMGIFRSVMN